MKIWSLLGFTLVFFLNGCFTSADDEATAEQQKGSIVPSVENFFYDLPSSLASENPTESLVVNPTVLPRRLSRSVAEGEAVQLEERGTIFDAYRPVPLFLHLANEAKNQVKAFVKELESKEIPENVDLTENGVHIVSQTIDTTILGKEQKFFNILLETEEGETLLKMNYWKNARGQYRGNFYFYERNPESDFYQGSIHFHYNGHNEELLGRRMLVTFFKPEETLEKATDPSVVRVWARKTEDRVFVKGASYHPLFQDENWDAGARLYAFQGVTNLAKDRSVLRVAFAKADEDLSNLWETHSLDQVVLKTVVDSWKKSLVENEEMRKLVAWGIAENKDMAAMGEAIALGTYQEVEMDAEEITVEDFLKFIQINREFILSEEKEKGKSDFGELLKFLQMKQPIFLGKGGVILGGIEAAIPEDFGVKSTELEEAESLDVDFGEMDALDAETEGVMQEQES